MALANTESIANKPKRLSHVEAAALPLVGVSVWKALVENIGLSKDQKVLIHGGAGGIGSIAIQLAKYLGAREDMNSKQTTDSESSSRHMQSKL